MSDGSQHYPNAPIREAIIDIRVRLPEDVTTADLARFHEPHLEAYPKQFETGISELRFEGGERPRGTVRDRTTGSAFASPDGRQVVQARLDGFAFSRLWPYERWEPFRDEARRLWQSYRDRYRPTAVTRLGVRYINRLDLPAPADLKRYLRVYPEVPATFSQGPSGLLMQLTIPQKDLPGHLILTEALAEPGSHNQVCILLDFDIYRDQDVPEAEEDLWRFFETLRRRKNAAFEASVTDQAKELFR